MECIFSTIPNSDFVEKDVHHLRMCRAGDSFHAVVYDRADKSLSICVCVCGKGVSLTELTALTIF